MGFSACLDSSPDHKPRLCITIWAWDQDDDPRPRVSTTSERILVRHTPSLLQLTQVVGN